MNAQNLNAPFKPAQGCLSSATKQNYFSLLTPNTVERTVSVKEVVKKADRKQETLNKL